MAEANCSGKNKTATDRPYTEGEEEAGAFFLMKYDGLQLI
jgi:hypothetical protein